MQPLGAVGPGATEFLADLAPELDGRVATVVARPDETFDPDLRADATYECADDGSWRATGRNRSLDDLLDDLAATYDYALLSGFPDAAVPTVAFGGADARDVVYEADSPSDADRAAVVDAADSRDPHVTLEALVNRVKASPRAERSGAIATFTGRVRAKDAEDDSPTVRLEFEKYEGVAEERLDRIRDELTDRDGVFEVVMHHRTGVIESGEDIVFVVVLAGHREEAFRTVEDGINRLKDEVPIFKKETTVDEEFWVHDRP